MKIGMRTIKTSIAVTISISLGYLLKLNSPFFAGIASIMALQGNLVESYTAGKDRVLGTILGAAIGLLCSFISIGNPIIIGLGTIVVIYLCNKLGWSKSITIATVVFISIIINVEKGQELYYSLNRVLDTTVGIIVAVIVNYAISPPLTKDKIYSESLKLVNKLSQALKAIIMKENTTKINQYFTDIEKMLEKINKEYPIFIKEMNIKLYKNNFVDINLEHSRILLKRLYNNLNLLSDLGPDLKVDTENSNTIYNKYSINLIGTDELNNLDIVYNYHLKNSLELLQELREMYRL